MKFLVLFTLAISCIPCFSQSEKKERTCRIIYLQRPQDAPQEAYLYDGKESHKVELPAMNFSEVVILPMGDLVLGMTPSALVKPEEFPPNAPSIRVPEKLTDFYILVAYDPENKVLPVRMMVIDSGDERVKLGETLWINLTKNTIAGKLGNESLMIPPSARVVGKSPLPVSGYFKAQFLYQPDGASPFMPVMNKSWWYDSNSKNLGFIIDSGGRLPRIFTFRDQRAPKAKKSTQ